MWMNQSATAAPARSGRVLARMTFRRGIVFSFGDRDERKQEVDEGSDGQRVDQGADADRAAQQPSGGQNTDLDGGAGAADGEATCGEPGHQAVAGTRSQPGPDVQGGGDGVDEDR